MTKSNKKTICIIIMLALLISSMMPVSMSPTFADDSAYELTIDYNSGNEKKFVITGPLLSADQERVFTETELKQLFATDKDKGDLHYFSMINTVLSKRAYTVRGVSLFDVFDYCGIAPSVYRNPDYFLHSLCHDGFLQVIGPGVEFSGQGGVTPTGTLDAPRYSYSENYPATGWALTPDFLNANLNDNEVDLSLVGREVPWVISFAESYSSAADGPTGGTGNPRFPAEGTNTDQTLRPFFGQLHIESQNLPLSADNTYRMIFAEERLTAAAAANISSAKVFTLGDTLYDRAHILTGPINQSLRGCTYGEKVKGSFRGANGDITLIEGTKVASLLYLGIIRTDAGFVPSYIVGPGEYAQFVNAAGENVIASYEEIVADNYTLVCRTGASIDKMATIDREISGEKYYFDLNRDGAPVIQNVSGIRHAYTVTFDADNGSEAVRVKVLPAERVTAPENPVKEGYRFTGWYLDETLFDFDTRITDHIVLTAQWEQDTLVKKGDLNGDGLVNQSDLLLMLNHYFEIASLDGQAYAAADINGDGLVNQSDLLLLLNHYFEIQLVED